MWEKGNGNRWQIQNLELNDMKQKHFSSKMQCILKSNKTDAVNFGKDINLYMIFWLHRKSGLRLNYWLILLI